MRNSATTTAPIVARMAGAPPVNVPASAVVVPAECAALLENYISEAPGARFRVHGETLRLAQLNMMLRGSNPHVDDTGARSWWAW